MSQKKEVAIETPAEMAEDTSVMEQSAASAEEMELKLLKERADQMKLSYHPSIGVATLRAKIAAVLNNEVAPKEEVVPVEAKAKPMVESDLDKKARLRAESHKLVRVIVNCMNPSKQNWEGEFFTVANSVVGTVRKYVPFNLEAGFHIPHIIYEQLLERKCQVFYTSTDSRNRMKTRKGKLINEFNVVVLPQLTPEELKELALQQAANNSID